jgi:hypothetical protein
MNGPFPRTPGRPPQALLDPTGLPTRIATPNFPNELDYCDDEVKAIFKGKSYQLGMPTQVQLVVSIRKLTAALAEKRP